MRGTGPPSPSDGDPGAAFHLSDRDCVVLKPMVSERMNRFRYRLNTRRYQMHRENALRMARLRYRMDNMAAGGILKIALVVLLGATPFVLYLILQPDTPTAVEDPVSNISRSTPPAPLAVPFTPSPAPSLDPSPTPSASPTPSPSPSPAAQCSNGKDDDRDGRKDFPTDKGCSSRTDRSESPDPNPTPPPPAPTPVPAADSPPPPLPSLPPPATLPQCSDREDNDGDGRTDFIQDGGCDSSSDNDETEPASSPTPTESPTVAPTPTETAAVQRTAPQSALPELAPQLESLLPGAVAPLS